MNSQSTDQLRRESQALFTPTTSTTSLPQLDESSSSPPQLDNFPQSYNQPTIIDTSPTSKSTPTMSSIQIKNRRKTYLERNPKYFTSQDLELADPLLYDRCIRRFQSAAEREADGKAKGWGGVLEADLWRGEARVEAVRKVGSINVDRHTDTKSAESSAKDGDDKHGDEEEYQKEEGSDTDADADAPTSKEEGLERWMYEMTMRFLHGLDEDFEYKVVDENEELDEVRIREEQERWFEDEEPRWSGAESSDAIVAGETGIQDF